jgi:hypothetical protein
MLVLEARLVASITSGLHRSSPWNEPKGKKVVSQSDSRVKSERRQGLDDHDT